MVISIVIQNWNEQCPKTIKDLESPVIELSDGSIFYVTEDGKAYQAFDGIQLNINCRK